mmetsp:Transcript_45929/g.111251  ORF Transcript_45929/g.111251 Transcript_45929/m.111251 type:complete len:405 (+) Transcript_45929:227-1441(+)
MMFHETFLQSKNQDCLGQVLSFLTCKDLANVARTSKVLQRTIFEEDDVQGYINLIWQGAEQALTNPWDKQSIFAKGIRRVGSNARKHCHLFAIASKAAKECERSDEIEEDRIMVDGVLADLMNVRGFDAESVAEKKEIGAKASETMDDAVANLEFKPIRDEELEEMQQHAREKQLQLAEKWEKLGQLSEPKKTYHHSVFVRLTKASSGEVISEGFCGAEQKLPWFAGLEMSRDCSSCFGIMAQGLQIMLDFESLKQSEEIQNFLLAHSSTESMVDAMGDQGSGINLTAVVIDRRNHNVQCLFRQDPMEQSRLPVIRPGAGVCDGFVNHSFPLEPSWGHDSIQLGPSPSSDLFFLSFHLSLCVATLDDRRLLIPILEVYVKEDRSAFNHAICRHLLNSPRFEQFG